MFWGGISKVGGEGFSFKCIWFAVYILMLREERWVGEVASGSVDFFLSSLQLLMKSLKRPGVKYCLCMKGAVTLTKNKEPVFI